MKEKLTNALGGFGTVLWFIISYLFMVLPFIFIGLPWWADATLLAVVMFLPVIGTLTSIVLWIWGLVAAIQGPQDFFAILMYVAFAINFLVYALPNIISFLSSLFRRNYY